MQWPQNHYKLKFNSMPGSQTESCGKFTRPSGMLYQAYHLPVVHKAPILICLQTLPLESSRKILVALEFKMLRHWGRNPPNWITKICWQVSNFPLSDFIQVPPNMSTLWHWTQMMKNSKCRKQWVYFKYLHFKDVLYQLLVESFTSAKPSMSPVLISIKSIVHSCQSDILMAKHAKCGAKWFHWQKLKV